MKNKFIKTVATLLLAFTLLSNWAMETASIIMPGASTCAVGLEPVQDDDDEDYGYLPYHK